MTPSNARRRSSARARIALLLLPAVLALVFRDFFRESLVVPLLYVLWLGYEYVRSLPQAALWGLFLFFGFVWVLRSGLRVPVRPKRKRPEEEEPPGRVEVWRGRVRLARRSRGGYGERYFAHHLAKLALQVLADRYRVEPRQLQRAIAQGRSHPALDLPDEAIRVVWTGLGRPSERPSRGPLDPEPLLQVLEEELHILPSERRSQAG